MLNPHQLTAVAVVGPGSHVAGCHDARRNEESGITENPTAFVASEGVEPGTLQPTDHRSGAYAHDHHRGMDQLSSGDLHTSCVTVGIQDDLFERCREPNVHAVCAVQLGNEASDTAGKHPPKGHGGSLDHRDFETAPAACGRHLRTYETGAHHKHPIGSRIQRGTQGECIISGSHRVRAPGQG
jgi:hypothetical protein